MNTPRFLSLPLPLLVSLVIGALSTAAAGEHPKSPVAKFEVPLQSSQMAFDYAGAQPVSLPRTRAPETLELRLSPNRTVAAARDERTAHHAGGRGDGREDPVVLPRRAVSAEAGIVPQAYGTVLIPFSSARNDAPKTTNKTYPSRASGKLYINTGSGTAQCSASLIERGIVVTAAHCVAPFGSGEFYRAFQFVPGYRNGVAPYGVWDASAVWAMSSWVQGTDPCVGVVCQNDVAVLQLAPKDGALPGTRTGWYGFGWGGWGFTPDGVAHITAIGYPICLDGGELQQRNDSAGYMNPDFVYNTLIGSRLCEGSSGGPWLVNFGIQPKFTDTTAGSDADPNSVVGVTSWGMTDRTIKLQGASPFTETNIALLFEAACAASPVKCK